MNKIDRFSRYQPKLRINHLFPKLKGYCSCGCGRKLSGRQKRWFSDECRESAYHHFLVIKGDQQIIRYKLFLKEKGFCRNCGVYCERWEADHIIPVHLGGGGCDITNYQTLCYDCHKEKSNKEATERSSQRKSK